MLVDIVLSVVFVSFIIKYYRKGFTLSLLGTGRIASAFALSLLYGDSAARGIEKLFSLRSEELDYISETLVGALTAVLGRIIIFSTVWAVFSIVGDCVKRADIPLFTRIDKALGGFVGVVIGLAAISLLADLSYASIDLASDILGRVEIMDIYNESLIFKGVYNLSFLDIIGEIISYRR